LYDREGGELRLDIRKLKTNRGEAQKVWAQDLKVYSDAFTMGGEVASGNAHKRGKDGEQKKTMKRPQQEGSLTPKTGPELLGSRRVLGNVSTGLLGASPGVRGGYLLFTRGGGDQRGN